jgi:NADP-dependent 3-hydroxy acid dehydrogenase YdfG
MSAPKIWFITGCSSGFGAALTREALARGDKVIATARNASRLSDLKSEGADILDWEVTASLPELKKKAEEAFNLYGRIDYLINNAGESSHSRSSIVSSRC